MKSHKLILTLISVAYIFSNCGNERKYKLEHFATNFIDGYELSCWREGDIAPYSICLQVESEKPSIRFKTKDQSIINKFKEIAKRMGDTCHKEVEIITRKHDQGVYRPFAANLFQKITITSDIDWDEHLPTGVDLSSEFMIAMITFDRYIQTCQKPTKYQPLPEDISPNSPWMQEYLKRIYAEKDSYGEPLVGHLQSIDFSQIKYWSVANCSDIDKRYDNRFMWPGMNLTSNHPSLSKPQTLTFKVTYQDGMTASTSLEIE